MSEEPTEEESQLDFMKKYENASKNIFRLEILPEYRVGEDELINK